MMVDYECTARELVRALRGKRSQPALSKRLGYRTNVVYTWEAGRAYPTGAGLLRLSRAVGVQVESALDAFYGGRAAWLGEVHDITSPAAVATLLADLCAGRPITAIAEAAGLSRFATARMLRGDTEPRLPDFLRLVEATSQRLLDFLAAFTKLERMPSLAGAAKRLDAARRIAYEEPFAHAVLRCMELSSYRALPRHQAGFIADRLGISLAAERRYIQLLRDSGQLVRRGHRYEVAETQMVDTRNEPERARALRRFWSETAAERGGAQDKDVLAFALGSVALADVERLRDLHRRYYAELRELIAASEPAEAVVLATVNLVRMA